MSSDSTPQKTPFLNFLAFLLAFGWEGPVIVMIGWRHNSTLEMAIGVLFTVFFWAMFGFRLLSDVVKHLLQSKSPNASWPASVTATRDE